MCLKTKQICASLCPLHWFWPSETRRCWQAPLQLHMVVLWLPLLFRGEERRVLAPIQAPLPGSDLPNYHPAKRPLTRAGLSPLLGLQPAFLQCQSWNSAFFCLFTQDLSASYSLLPLTPHPSHLSTHSITNTFSLRRSSPMVFIARPRCPDMKS